MGLEALAGLSLAGLSLAGFRIAESYTITADFVALETQECMACGRRLVGDAFFEATRQRLN
ncbi:hypothetical protein AO275_25350 [Pseudomonas viridiflava]|nr:hypothetical protein AO275_25350 [Pseudomonas viridiflava]